MIALEPSRSCNYCYYMKPVPLKVARIGNSRGVRLPAATLERYRISDRVLMEERSDGILLRPETRADPKLSWEETASAMASSHEHWSPWDTTSADGLDTIPWEDDRAGRVAERPPAAYDAKPKAGQKKRS